MRKCWRGAGERDVSRLLGAFLLLIPVYGDVLPGFCARLVVVTP